MNNEGVGHSPTICYLMVVIILQCRHTETPEVPLAFYSDHVISIISWRHLQSQIILYDIILFALSLICMMRYADAGSYDLLNSLLDARHIYY